MATERRRGSDQVGLRARGNGSLLYERVFALVSLTLAVALGFAVSAERAIAATAARATVFVVDTSTSMAGRPLAEAKSALVGGTTAVPAGAQVSLRSFGGPCGDGGIVRLPLGPFDQATFSSAVDSLSIGASGTPTPAALRAAAANLPSAGDRTLILVSDGQSGCGDPCPVARELADRLGAGFRIDAVGFRAPNSAEAELDCIARVTGGTYVSATDPAGLQKTLAESTAARVTALRLSRTTFAAAAKGGSIGTVARAKVGTRVSYTISERAKVRFTIERALEGRKVDGKCQKLMAANGRARPCRRYTALSGGFTHDGKQGVNHFAFTGRRRGKKLPPGRYKLVATATDAAGNMAKSLRAKFRIARR
jgi:hypothetical protein